MTEIKRKILDREGVELIVTFLAAPLAWTLHLLISYLVIAVACNTGWGGTRWLIAGLTIVLAGASLFSAYGVFREWPRPLHPFKWLAHNEQDASVTDFLLGLGLIVTGLFTLAIILGGVGTLMLPICAPGHH